MSDVHSLSRSAAADPVDAPPARTRRGRWPMRRLLIAFATGLSLILAGLYGDYWWNTGRFLVTTDDAYVEAHSAPIAPQVSGYIIELPVNDNERVQTGQLLARIDPRLYQAALDQARANVVATQANIGNIDAQMEVQQAQIAADRAQLNQQQAALVFAQQQATRYQELARTALAGTVQDAQRYTSGLQQQQAAVDSAEATLKLAQRQVDTLEAQRASAIANLKQAKAQRDQAQINLGYTTIVAPFDGVVGVRTATIGPYVEPGTQLMAIVPLREVYITANYKETELTDVRPGQPVTIDIDTFPGLTVHGTVESVAPASGENFALLPPDNATGNFTKIVQRIPVKIAIDKSDPLLGMLRPGMSVEPTIDTKPAAADLATGRAS